MTVELREIATDEDRAEVLAIRRGPGQERHVASVEQSLADAARIPNPRLWTIRDDGRVVGFAMISDGMSPDDLARFGGAIEPYFLWRLLIDVEQQGRGYGTAALDAIAAFVATRPDAASLSLSCTPGEGSPQPFYERYGFVPTGAVVEGEVVLALDLRRDRP